MILLIDSIRALLDRRHPGRAVLVVLSVVALGMCSASPGGAQWAANGAPICTASGFQTAPSVCSDGSASFAAWRDTRAGAAGIYVQKFDGNGVPQWTANGVAASTAVSSVGDPNICSDGRGGVVVAWADDRSGVNQIFLQRVFGGVAKWTTNGIALTSDTVVVASSPAIVAEPGTGAVTVAWEGDPGTGSPDIYAQRIDSTGAAQYVAGGSLACGATGTQSGARIAVLASPLDPVITWTDQRAGNRDIYAQRLARLTGAAQWGVNGVAVCVATGDQLNVTMATSPSIPGVVFAWQDNRLSNYDIFAQQLNMMGAPVWAVNGVVACTASGDQAVPSVVFGTQIFVAWQDARSGTLDIYYQAFSLSGVRQLAADGVALCTATASQSIPVGAIDDPVARHGAIFAWRDHRNGANDDVYAQRVNDAGSILWPADGTPLCTAAGNQQAVVIAPVSAGVVTVAWQDSRVVTSDIYAQRVADDFLITAIPGANGSILPPGTTSVPRDSSKSYSIVPSPLYHVADVQVDSSSVGAVTNYSFAGVNTNHTISATFDINVVVNEFLARPAVGRAEFYEILNESAQTVDLNGWILTVNGLRDTIRCSGGGCTLNLAPGAYYVDSSFTGGPQGFLPDHAGVIRLYRNTETILDQVAYGDSGGAPVFPPNSGGLLQYPGHQAVQRGQERAALGGVAQPSQAAGTEQSVVTARLPNGTDTDQDASDFNATSATTGAPNAGTASVTTLGTSVFLSRIYMHGTGNDAIELYNPLPQPLDFTGYLLTDGGDNVESTLGVFNTSIGVLQPQQKRWFRQGEMGSFDFDITYDTCLRLYAPGRVPIEYIGWKQVPAYDPDLCVSRTPTPSDGYHNGYDFTTSGGPQYLQFQSCNINAERTGVVEPAAVLSFAGAIPTPSVSLESTVMVFSVPGVSGGTARHVWLALYDVAGRLMGTLVNGPLAPGPHRVSLGRAGARGRLSPGIYLAVLEVGRGRLTRHVVVLQ